MAGSFIPHIEDALRFKATDLLHPPHLPHMRKEHFRKVLFVSIVVIGASHFAGPFVGIHDAEFWASMLTNFLFFQDSITIHGKIATGLSAGEGVVEDLEEAAEEV